MSATSKIEWTEATWNPVRGCSLVSSGCTNCYAMGLAYRTSQGPKWTGKIRLVPEALSMPRKWRRPRNIFVNSMTDLFHEGVPDEFILQVFQVMNETTFDGGADCGRIRGNGREGHVYQILTKCAERMRSFVSRLRWRDGLHLDGPGRQFTNRHIWLGVSAEDQKTADERLWQLMITPALMRWVSAEPMLGRLDLRKYLTGTLDMEPNAAVPSQELTHWGAQPKLSWVVAGGESGPSARPMHPDWARSLRDQCAAARVPFLFKQWGEWTPDSFVGSDSSRMGWLSRDGTLLDDTLEVHNASCEKPCLLMSRAGKKAAGRQLDGVQHDGFPEVRA